MGRQKKIEKVELVSSQVEDAVVNKEEVVKEESIFDKYRNMINQANSDYLSGYNYGDVMDILRYVEKFYGHAIPLNASCAACVIDLIKSFGRLEQK